MQHWICLRAFGQSAEEGEAAKRFVPVCGQPEYCRVQIRVILAGAHERGETFKKCRLYLGWLAQRIRTCICHADRRVAGEGSDWAPTRRVRSRTRQGTTQFPRPCTGAAQNVD